MDQDVKKKRRRRAWRAFVAISPPSSFWKVRRPVNAAAADPGFATPTPHAWPTTETLHEDPSAQDYSQHVMSLLIVAPS